MNQTNTSKRIPTQINEFRGDYAFLSNFYPAPVSYMGQINITTDNWLTLHAYLNIPVVLSPALPQKEQSYTSYRVHV